ncbi:MAG: hypothetical protein FJ320_09475 [SAR202 cluster bacterium]|nr:hypothetical protein [SAR202 cluster bacterium]
MKRRWLVVSVAAAALAALAVGGAVFAASNRDGSGGAEREAAKEEYTNRVAEILGKDPAEVKSAVKQARREQMDEVINEHLDKLVEKGELTQAEADEIKAWLAERPEALSKLGPFFGHRPFLFEGQRLRHFGRHHHFFKAFPCPEDEAPAETPSATPGVTSF